MNIFETELFSGISENTKSRLEKTYALKSSKKGEILFLQEDNAKFFFLIKSGWVKLFRETLDGEEAVVDVITSGHVFGNHALFEDMKYSYGAETVEDAVIYQIPIHLISDSIHEDQQFALNFIRLISSRQRKNRKEIEHLTIQTAPQRIGCFLLRLCKDRNDKNVKINLPYDKSLIASRLGMKPETFSRALSKLREEVSMNINGSSVILPDVAKLTDFTCSACSNSFPCEDAKI